MSSQYSISQGQMLTELKIGAYEEGDTGEDAPRVAQEIAKLTALQLDWVASWLAGAGFVLSPRKAAADREWMGKPPVHDYRMVRVFPNPLTSAPGQTNNVCYKVETTALMTSQQAMQLLSELGSPYSKDTPHG